MNARLNDSIRDAPHPWLLVAAVLLILVLLVSIGMLAQTQTEKAEQRNARQVSQREAVLRCLRDGRATRIDVCAAAQDRTQQQLAGF
jgi:hypothetical protein